MSAPDSRRAFSDVVEIGDGRRVRVTDVIGKGTSASVFRGVLETPSDLRRGVALKLFDPVATEDAQRVAARLVQTAKRTACVQHPNVVQLYELGILHAQPYYVLELVDGVSLQVLVDRHAARQTRLPLDLSLFVAMEVLEALSGARTAVDDAGVQVGLLHLGLSLREVLLSWRGEVKVTDFELHRARSASSSVRSASTLAARASSMPPEIAQGLPGDARSDVFAMGILMRELLVGPRFPRGLSNAEAVHLAREGYVQPMCFQPHLPEHLVAIMQRAIEIDPALRHPNASAMAFELRRVALAMGVGDGRWFLRRALEHEWGNDEATIERPPSFEEHEADPAVDGVPGIMESGVQLVEESDVEDVEDA